MLVYLFDACVVVEFYQPQAAFQSPSHYQRSSELRQNIASQKLAGDAILFVPAFCVAEVCDTFAKMWYRRKGVFDSEAHYRETVDAFLEDVHDRKFFYSYDLVRYHNLNAHEVFPIEHTTETEFDAAELPLGSSRTAVKRALRNKRKGVAGNYYLRAVDILIIAMGMELKRLYGSDVYLLSGDRRLLLISGKDQRFPTPLSWRRITTRALPKP